MEDTFDKDLSGVVSIQDWTVWTGHIVQYQYRADDKISDDSISTSLAV